METRCPLEWHCKQMDHFVGLNFSTNFNFALVGHLLKGMSHTVRNRSSMMIRNVTYVTKQKLVCICCTFAGYRHPSPTTVARTVRILHTLLALISKHLKCDKFEVNIHSVAYLAGV